MRIFRLDDVLNTFDKGKESANLYDEVKSYEGLSAWHIAKKLGVTRGRIRRWVEKRGSPPCVKLREKIKELGLPQDTNHPKAKYFGQLFYCAFLSEGLNEKYLAYIIADKFKGNSPLGDYFEKNLGVPYKKFKYEMPSKTAVVFPAYIGRALIASGFPEDRHKVASLPKWIKKLPKGTLTDTLLATSATIKPYQINLNLLQADDYETAKSITKEFKEVLEKELNSDVGSYINSENKASLLISGRALMLKVIKEFNKELNPLLKLNADPVIKKLEKTAKNYSKAIKAYKLVLELRNKGRTLGEIRDKISKQGYNYSETTIQLWFKGLQKPIGHNSKKHLIDLGLLKE